MRGTVRKLRTERLPYRATRVLLIQLNPYSDARWWQHHDGGCLLPVDTEKPIRIQKKKKNAG